MNSKPLADPQLAPLFEQLPALNSELARIPASHYHLLDGPYWAALTTLTFNGQPQTTPVWCNREGGYVLFNTMRGFLKDKNMRANPHVSLLVYDSTNPLHYIEIEGVVIEMTETGAVEHNDLLTRLYTGNPAARFFGDAVSAELAENYHPIKVTMAPIRVRIEGLNSGSEGEATIPVSIKDNILTPPVEIPQSHKDLLLRPIYGVLATLMSDAQPYSSLVWVDHDGAEVLINISLESQECQNLQTNHKVTLLVVDPQNTSRYLEIRGQMVELTTEGAAAQAYTLNRRYSTKGNFSGELSPVERHQKQPRVRVRIRPVKVTHDAFFNRVRSIEEGPRH